MLAPPAAPAAQGNGLGAGDTIGESLPPPNQASQVLAVDDALTDARPRRKWPWIVAIAGVVLAVGIVVLYGLSETVLTHELLEADFDSGAYPFVEDERKDYVVEVVDGEYRISAKTASPSEPAVAFAWFARTAWNLEAEATVVRVPDSDSAGVGIACIPESAEAPIFDGGFLFLVGGGEAGLIGTWGDDDSDRSVPMTLESGQRIGINCQSEVLTRNQPVQGTIDGEVVLEIPNGHSEGFDRLALVYFQLPADEADFAVFDDVSAEVP